MGDMADFYSDYYPDAMSEQDEILANTKAYLMQLPLEKLVEKMQEFQDELCGHPAIASMIQFYSAKKTLTPKQVSYAASLMAAAYVDEAKEGE